MDEKLTSMFAAAVGGAVVGQIVAWLNRRRSSKEELNQAIADLMELHFFLQTYIGATKAVESRLPLPPEVMPALKKLMLSILPMDPEFHARYGKAVDAVCRYDPVLGYRLRSRDYGRKILDHLAAIPLEVALGPLADFDVRMASVCVDNLRELIPQIAGKCGWCVRRRVAKALARVTLDVPPEFENFAK